MDFGDSILGLVRKGLAQYRSPITIIPGLLRLGARQMLAGGLSHRQIDKIMQSIDRGGLDQQEKLVVVRVAVYLAAEAALPGSPRTDLDACFESARKLLATACRSVAHESLYCNHVRASCLEAVQMYVDMIKQVCIEEPRATTVLKRSQHLLRQIKALLEPREHIRVFSVFDLLTAGKFPRCQECSFLRVSDPSRVTLMVSHRWEAPHCPDPEGMQFHRVVRFVVKACMMAMGSSPSVFNGVDFSDVVLCPELYFHLADIYREHVAWWTTRTKREAVEGFSKDERLHGRLSLLSEYLKDTIGKDNTALVAPDLVPLTFMMDHIDIWYDYTSLPQTLRSAAEEAEFQVALADIDHAFSRNYTVILWSKNSLNRTWCLFEALLSTRNWRHNLFSSENSIRSSPKPAPINELRYRPWRADFVDEEGRQVAPSFDLSELSEAGRQSRFWGDLWDSETLAQFGRQRQNVDLTHDLSSALRTSLHQVTKTLRGEDETEVLAYLRSHGYRCTNEFDLELLAEKLSRHISDFPEQGVEGDAADRTP